MNSFREFQNFRFRSLLLWTMLGLIAAPKIVRLFVRDDRLAADLADSALYLIVTAWLVGNFYYGRIKLSRFFGPFPLKRAEWTRLLVFIPLASFSYGTAFLACYLLSYIAPALLESELDSGAIPSLRGTFLDFFGFLESTIIAPVLEEVLFRGVLLHRWAEKWGVKTAVLASSLVFVFFHLSLVNALSIFVFGMILAGVYLRTRSLFVPILIHVLNNSLAMTLLILFRKEGPYVLLPSQLYSFAWTGCIALCVSVPWLIWFIQRNRPDWNASVPYYASASSEPHTP